MSANLVPSTSAGGFSTVGNVTGNYIIGNGSQLTGIVTSIGNTISNGTSNVTIPIANANVTVNVGNTSSWTFGDNGLLTFPGTPRISTDTNNFEVQAAESVNFEANAVVNIYTDTSGSAYQWQFGDNGNLTFPDSTVYTGNTFTTPESNGTLNKFAWEFSDLAFGSDTVSLKWNLLDTTLNQWLFSTGTESKIWNLDSSTQQLSFGNAGDPVLSALTFGTATNSGTGNVNSIELTSTNSNAYIRANNYSWTFGSNGTLTVPYEGVIQSIDDTVILQSKDTGTGNTFSARLGTNGGFYFETTAYPQGWLNLVNNAGNADINALPGTGGAGGKSISINAGAADQTDFYGTPGGDVNILGGLGANGDGNGGGPGGSINITAGNSADPSGHAGNINITTGPEEWTFGYGGELWLPGNTAYISSNANTVSIYSDTATEYSGLYIESDIVTQLTNSANVQIIANTGGITNYAWLFDNTGNLTIPNSILAQDVSSPSPLISGFEFVGSLTGNVSTTGVVVTPLLSSIGNIAISTGNVVNVTSTINFNVNGAAYGQLGVGVALGYGAGNGLGNVANAMQLSGVAIGTQAGQNGQGSHAIAVGWRTGENSQSTHAVAIGENAAFVGQGDSAIAVGYVSGREGQGEDAVAIGRAAAYTSQSANAIAIGQNAGYSAQGQYAVAIGALAGNIGQGGSAVAVGSSSGASAQGVNSVAVGTGAGEQTQGAGSTALGFVAGQVSQGGFAVAIGGGAGGTNQGNGAIAIGADAAITNQGQYAIAIGALTANASQPAHSIIIDATGNSLNGSESGLYIAPVRNDTGNTTNAVYYNTSTKEVTYGPVSGGTYGNADVAANLAAFGSNPISTSGDITAGNFYSTGVVSATGNVRGGNINTTGSITATGNIITGAQIQSTAFTGGNIYWAANNEIRLQGALLVGGSGVLKSPGGASSITLNNNGFSFNQATGTYISVLGNVTAASVVATVASIAGNITSGNISTAGFVSAAGNVYGNVFVGNGAGLTNIAVSLVGNVQGTQSNVTLQAGSYSWTFDTTGKATFPLSLVTTPVPFANLTAVAGARAFVNNSNLAAAGNYGAQISGGGANTVPVWSNGTNWYIG